MITDQKIVLTGCSGSGKTSIWKLLKKQYSSFPEVATELIACGLRAPISSDTDSLTFAQQVLDSRIQHFLLSANSQITIFDRGIPDALGFSYYLKKEPDPLLLGAISEYRYTHILLFPPWEEIFTNNSVRSEPFQVAMQIYEYIKEAYTNSGYIMTMVPKLKIDERLEFVNDFISKSQMI